MGAKRGAPKHELDVRDAELRPGLDEGVQTARNDGCRPGAEEMSLDQTHRHDVEAHGPAERASFGTRVGDLDCDMILKILPDGKIGDRIDSNFFKMIGGTDAGKHEQLRCVESTGRKNDFTLGTYSRSGPILRIFDSDRAALLDENFQRPRIGRDMQICAALGRSEVSVCRRRAPPIADRILAASETLMRPGIVILGMCVTGCFGRFDPGAEKRIFCLRPFDTDEAISAAFLALAVLPAFNALEIGEHIPERPAMRPIQSPAVIVAGITPGKGHHIDRGGAAQDFSAHGFDAPPVQIGLRLAVISPVKHTSLVHLAEAEGDMNEGMAVASASLQ